ncbi:hypothetical protein BT96DRAFT_933331 [Gymnopus androsaceus JB14]|uniref:Uncharacterized protein n=1 Tax=Gymnopus androsaceus JB14 TaxID=1447944 RepID=A0A6A4IG13_9AGAR|nr:hypothetical protein BT96DRAFT_933331 [Gymnopus androsaceus JB14]
MKCPTTAASIILFTALASLTLHSYAAAIPHTLSPSSVPIDVRYSAPSSYVEARASQKLQKLVQKAKEKTSKVTAAISKPKIFSKGGKGTSSKVQETSHTEEVSHKPPKEPPHREGVIHQGIQTTPTASEKSRTSLEETSKEPERKDAGTQTDFPSDDEEELKETNSSHGSSEKAGKASSSKESPEKTSSSKESSVKSPEDKDKEPPVKSPEDKDKEPPVKSPEDKDKESPVKSTLHKSSTSQSSNSFLQVPSHQDYKAAAKDKSETGSIESFQTAKSFVTADTKHISTDSIGSPRKHRGSVSSVGTTRTRVSTDGAGSKPINAVNLAIGQVATGAMGAMPPDVALTDRVFVTKLCDRDLAWKLEP